MCTRVAAVLALALIASRSDAFAQNVDAGRKAFESRCARCHGADGNGGEMGPPIAQRLPPLDDQALSKLIHEGIPAKGMPPSVDRRRRARRRSSRSCARSQRAPDATARPRDASTTTDGRTLEGEVLGEGFDDLQLRTDDKRVHLLRRAGERFRAVTSESRLADLQRRSRRQPLHDADADRQDERRRGWRRTGCSRCPDAGQLQGTPVVVDGIMYVTAPNECYALDAGSGRQIWHFKRPRTQGRHAAAAPIAASASPAIACSWSTDNAHLIALNRFTGELLWDTRAGRLAQELRGLVGAAARRQPGHLRRGRRRARRQRLRRRARPGDRQGGLALLDRAEAGRAGIGDVAGQGHRARRRADLVHRQLRSRARHSSTGRPATRARSTTATIARATTSTRTRILALDRKTGTLKWHYQFTPHDLWDWDATQTSVLVDADWQGQPRQADAARRPQRLLLRVRSRATASCCWRSRSCKNLTWASGIGADGRPDQAAEPGAVAGRARRCARRRTAPPTGSRRRSTRRPGSTTCRRSRSAASTRRREQGAVGDAARRISADRSGPRPIPKPQRILQGDRHPHRRDHAGSCRSRARRSRGAAR